jgi:hypothetical protein
MCKFSQKRQAEYDTGTAIILSATYKFDTVFSDKSPYRSSTVDGVFYYSFGTYYKSRCVKVIIALAVKGACQGGDPAGVQPVAYTVCEPVPLDSLESVFPGICRCGNDLYVPFFEFGDMSLKVQQLLPAEDSPVASVKKEYIPSDPEITGQSCSDAASSFKNHLGENIACVKYLAVRTGHPGSPVEVLRFA